MRTNENHNPTYRTPAATLAVRPTRDDFNFYARPMNEDEMHEKMASMVTELAYGLGYSLVMFAIFVLASAIFKTAVG